MASPPNQPEERIPKSLGATDYQSVWNNLAGIREHAFELVDESQNEADLQASGEKLAPFLIQGLGIGPDDVVFEIGCGVARLGKVIAPHAKQWWGLDVSSRMVEIANERRADLDNVRTFVGNGADLADVPDASVDKMYCHAVFIHMDKEDVYSYLVDAKRVLKPGGLFYFDVWNIADPVGWLRWQMERTLYSARADRPVHRNQFSSPDEVRAMLKAAGWELLQLSETFYIQPVVTHVPEGADREAFLADVRARSNGCYEVMHYTAGDYEFFSQVMIARLAEYGRQPEVSQEEILRATRRFA